MVTKEVPKFFIPKLRFRITAVLLKTKVNKK